MHVLYTHTHTHTSLCVCMCICMSYDEKCLQNFFVSIFNLVVLNSIIYINVCCYDSNYSSSDVLLQCVILELLMHCDSVVYFCFHACFLYLIFPDNCSANRKRVGE